jgi:cysteine synthase
MVTETRATPLVRVDGIWVKLEYLNPSGSVKDRIAKYMIERAEREGLLRPGDTIVEASSGNTGNAMSMVAAVKGYQMLVVMPEGMSPERLAISRAFAQAPTRDSATDPQQTQLPARSPAITAIAGASRSRVG